MELSEALEKMEALIGPGDTERQHSEADSILLKVLESLGYVELVEAWCKVDKWYA